MSGRLRVFGAGGEDGEGGRDQQVIDDGWWTA